MKIILVGYGKMGRIIEKTALERGHEIVGRIDLENASDLNADLAAKADAAIEFTGPHSAFDNVMKCLSLGIPVVCGSTGWLDRYEEVAGFCRKQAGSLLYASNFSVGVNIFFEINKTLARLMGNHPGYDVSIREVHHTQKKDAPSGTAITLAEQVLRDIPGKENWVNEVTGQTSDLVISSERIDPYPGLHTVRYASSIDEIRITHEAHSRDGFALGAVLAAEFIKDRTGVFSMKDVLGIGD
jgi:4-hydroxy-tetrahydrodipicolinate reductase